MRFLGHDEEHDCNIWQYREKPLIPECCNETVCIRMTDEGSIFKVIITMYVIPLTILSLTPPTTPYQSVICIYRCSTDVHNNFIKKINYLKII